jgi:fatty-acyl-CoA synthase
VPGGPPSPAAFVQTTSGTTGDPKGVVVSQRAVLAHIDTLRETFAAGPQDRALGWLPFFHDMGLIGTLLAPLVIGLRSTLWSPAGFLARPSEWFAMVEHTRATIAPVPPVGLDLLAKVARRRPVRAGALTSLRALLVGSEAVLPATLAAFSRVATPAGLRPDAVLPVYGLAEAVLAVSARRPGDGPRLVDVAGAPHVTCGPAVPGTELRVEGGELLVRARARMSEYLDDPVATAAALDGEWLRTGDHAVLDGDEVVVLGRLRDAIDRDGQRTPALDYEQAVATVEGVRPDRVVAFSVPRGGREIVVLVAESGRHRDGGRVVLDVRRQLADAGLAVDRVQLVPVGALPRTTSGKVRRTEARRRYIEEAAGAGR